MGLKKYVISTVILIIVVFGYVHSLELGEHTLSMFDYESTLPVSVWFIVPIAILSVATYLHIIFYSLIAYFKQRAINKDHEEMIELIKAQLLGKSANARFRTKDFKNLSSILSQFNFVPKDERFSSSNEELNKLVLGIQDITDGKYVGDKALKFGENSKLANLNMLNKVKEQVDFAADVLKKSENYSFEIVREAFKNVLANKSMTTVKKLYKNIKLDKELAIQLFEKDAANNEFGFTVEEVLKIVKDLEYKKDDYIKLAKIYETVSKPDQIIAIFEKLSTETDEATAGYLHVLCEYEMIDKVKDVLSSSNDSDYVPFRALIELKDAGKNHTLESISYK